MKKLLLLIILCPIVGLSSDTLIPPPRMSLDTLLSSNGLLDTIVVNSDSLEVNSLPGSRVVILKEAGEADNFKYIFPIFTLILGIVINKVLDRWFEHRRIKKAGERWIAELRCLEEPIKAQINAIQESLNELENEDLQKPELRLFAILSCDAFKSLDKSDLLKFIEQRKKIAFKDVVNSSNFIHSYIAALAYLYESIQSKFNTYLSKTSEHVESFSTNLRALTKAFVDYGIVLERDMGQDPIADKYYAAILSLFNAYITPHFHDGKYNIFQLEREFLVPLLKILSDLRLDPRVSNLMVSVNDCLVDMKGVKMEQLYYKENLQNLQGRYTDRMKELESRVKTLE